MQILLAFPDGTYRPLAPTDRVVRTSGDRFPWLEIDGHRFRVESVSESLGANFDNPNASDADREQVWRLVEVGEPAN